MLKGAEGATSQPSIPVLVATGKLNKTACGTGNQGSQPPLGSRLTRGVIGRGVMYITRENRNQA